MKTANKSANRLRSALLEIQKTPKSKGRRYSKQHPSEMNIEAVRISRLALQHLKIACPL